MALGTKTLTKSERAQINPSSGSFDPKVAAAHWREVGRRAGKRQQGSKQVGVQEEILARAKRQAFRAGEVKGIGVGRRGEESRQAALRRSQFAKDLKALDDYVKRLQGQIMKTRVKGTSGTSGQGRGTTGSFTQLMTRRVGTSIGSGASSAPSAFNRTGTMTMDRGTGSRFILVLSGICAATIVFKVRGSQDFQVGDHKVRVSAGLRQYVALIIITLIALVVNEVNPPIAVAFMLLLLFAIGVNSGLLAQLSRVLTNTTPVAVSSGPQVGYVPPSIPGIGGGGVPAPGVGGIPGNQGGIPLVPPGTGTPYVPVPTRPGQVG